MPNIKSAAKRARQAEKARQRNRAVRTHLKHLAKSVIAAMNAGRTDDAREAYRRYMSALDKAVKKGVLARNNANRRKSRMARRLAAAPSPTVQPAPAADTVPAQPAAG
ncbi:MAG: 30S ribosomal protein S20 [Kiritimatiellae bacterium]|nr:30S ribosomal protein S20 [Kiritimatiellia bacterium]